jgi:hypothetical protein
METEAQFHFVRKMLSARFGAMPDLNGILFLIGVNELGKLRTKFSKEQKQDLMHLAVCRLLSSEGIYRYVARDDDGWPHYERTAKLASLTLSEQEELLKQQIIRYFEENDLI